MLKSKTVCFFLLLYFAFTLLSASCKREAPSYPYSMVEAERLMNHHPDSARQILIAFEDSLKGLPEETGMYYHLLRVKAKDKCYIPHTSDSLITRITRYYEERTDRDKLMESYYYMGRVYWDLQNPLKALEYFQKAIDVSGGTERYDILCRIYGNLESLLTYQCAYEEATRVLKKLNNYVLLSKDSSLLYIPFNDMARVYEMVDKTDSAFIYYQKAYQLAKEANSNWQGVLVEQSDIYMKLGFYNEALYCLRLSLQDSVNRDMKFTYSALGDYFYQVNQLDSSAYYYKKGLNSSNLYVKRAAYRHLALIEKRKSNHSEAALYFKGWLEVQDSVRKVTPTESVCKAHALYNYQKMNAENRQLKLENTKKELFIAEILFVSLLLFCGIYFFARRVRLKKEEVLDREKKLREEKETAYRQSVAVVEENKKEIEALSIRLLQAENEKDAALQELLRNKKELLEITNQHLLAQQKNKELQQKNLICSDIYVKFHTACYDNTIRLEEEDWVALQEELDGKYNNFTARLYELYPRLSQMEVRICYLIKIAISVTQMAFLLGRSKSSISTARTRLYKKLFTVDGKPEELDSFIADL